MLFETEMSRKDWIILSAVSAAMTMPFIFILRDMADSLQIIANKR